MRAFGIQNLFEWIITKKNREDWKTVNNHQKTFTISPNMTNNKPPYTKTNTYTSETFLPCFSACLALSLIFPFNSFSKNPLISFDVHALSTLNNNKLNFAGDTFLNCESCSNLDKLSINTNLKKRVREIWTKTRRRDQLNSLYFSRNWAKVHSL